MESASLAVTDTTPLIALHAAGLLDVLCELFREVWLPLAVWYELTALPGAPEPQAVQRLRCVRLVPDTDALHALLTQLDPGEQQALALAMTLTDAIVLLDESAARRVARKAGLRHIGTIGIIAAAKKAGLCTSARDKYESLLRSGFRVDLRLVNDVLRHLGEEPLGSRQPGTVYPADEPWKAFK